VGLSVSDFHRYICSIRAETTADSYRKGANKLVDFMREQGHTFTEAPRSLLLDLVQDMASKGLHPKTIRLMLAGANRFLGWLRDRGVEVSELAKAEVPKSELRRAEIITQDVLTSYLEAASEQGYPHQAVLKLLPFTGLRVDEVCKLKLSSMRKTDHGVAFVFFGKGKKERLVPLSEQALTVLNNYTKEWRAVLGNDTDWLFPRIDDISMPLSPGAIRAQVRTVRARAGIPWLTPHKLRHVFATLLSQAGVQIEVIKDLLGHSKITTTQLYIHESPEAMHEAVDKIGDDP